MPAKVHDLDLAKLRAFEIVARNGTLQVAATRLNLTVSAISTQLKRLEELLGVELFRRTPSKLVITPEGERFAADVTQILDMTERALTRLGERGSHSGHVNISLGGDYAWLFMPKINSFSAQHRKITTTIKISPRHRVDDRGAERDSRFLHRRISAAAEGPAVSHRRHLDHVDHL